MNCIKYFTKFKGTAFDAFAPICCLQKFGFKIQIQHMPKHHALNFQLNCTSSNIFSMFSTKKLHYAIKKQYNNHRKHEIVLLSSYVLQTLFLLDALSFVFARFHCHFQLHHLLVQFFQIFFLYQYGWASCFLHQ